MHDSHLQLPSLSSQSPLCLFMNAELKNGELFVLSELYVIHVIHYFLENTYDTYDALFLGEYRTF